jgi:HK97 family phage major capsid protein
MSIIIPRGTTGSTEASQATENTAVSSTDQVWANLTVPVVTIAGQAPVSRQSLERGAPGTDSLIYGDLAGAYAAELDRQVVNGSGASNQMLGILQTAGVNQSTAFVAAATAATFYSKSAGAVNDVEENRFLPPTVIFMRPRRWNWLLSLVDSSNRPLAVPVAGGPNNAVATYDGPDYGKVVGYFLGLPVVTDANIPTNIGTGPEDVEIVARAEDLLLWEQGDGMPRELRFEQTLGNALTTTLVSYGYAAFTAGRYPKAVSLVGGNSAAGFGLVAPTF